MVAGPAIRKTIAAPGDNPFSNSTAAMGMEPVAQTYRGIEASRISSMERYSLETVSTKKLSGMTTARRAAIRKPMISHLLISCSISTKP